MKNTNEGVYIALDPRNESSDLTSIIGDAFPIGLGKNCISIVKENRKESYI